MENGKPLAFEEARHSGLAVGVPGMVGTWAQAARRYGTRGFSADLRPAIHRAVHGFRIDDTFVQETKESLADLQAFTASRRLFLRHGQPLPVGSTLRNPDLARTYRMLARRGPGYLYDGPLARAIAHTVQHPPVWSGTPLTVRPGIMTTADLRRLPGRRAGPDPRQLPRLRRLRDGAAVLGRFHHRRGAQHPVRLRHGRRQPCAVPAPLHRGTALRLCRPQPLRR